MGVYHVEKVQVTPGFSRLTLCSVSLHTAEVGGSSPSAAHGCCENHNVVPVGELLLVSDRCSRFVSLFKPLASPGVGRVR